MKKLTLFMSFVLLSLIGFQANADLWVIGDLGEGWDPSKGVQFTATGDNTYELEVSVSAGTKYYGFTSALASSSNDWGAIANSRFGSTNGSSDLEVPVGTATTVGTNADKSLKTTFEGAKYKLEFNTSTKVLLITKLAEEVFNGTIYITKNSTGKIWAWDSKGNYFNSWPGSDISSLTTTTLNGFEVYAFTYDHENGTGPGLIFSDGSDQTGDLVPEDGGLYCYKGGKNLAPAILQLGIVGELTGGWDADLVMTEGEDGVYTAVVEKFTTEAGKTYQYKARANAAWDGYQLPADGNQEYTFTEAGDYKLTFTANTNTNVLTLVADKIETPVETMETLAIVGELTGGWPAEEGDDGSKDIQMAKSEDADNIWTLTVTDFVVTFDEGATEKTYEYKARANKKWGVYDLPASGNNNYKFTKEGTYTLYFTANTTEHTLTLNVEEQGVEEVTTMGLMGSKVLFGGEEDWQAEVAMTQDATNDMIWTYTIDKIALEAGDYQYKARANNKWGLYELPAEGNQTINITEAGDYKIVFTANRQDHVLKADVTKIETPVEIDKMYLCGNADLLGGGAWGQFIELTANEAKTEWTYAVASVNLKAGTNYEYRAYNAANYDDFTYQLPADGNAVVAVEEDGEYKVEFTVNTAEHTINAVATKIGDYKHYVKLHHGIKGDDGGFGWQDSENIDAVDGKVTFEDIVFKKGDIFGFTIDGVWQTSSDDSKSNYGIHSGWNSAELPQNDNRYFEITDDGGTLTITVENVGLATAATKFTVTGWATEKEPALTLHYGTVDPWLDKAFEKSDNDGKWYLNDVVFEANTEFVFFDQDETWYKGNAKAEDATYGVHRKHFENIALSTEASEGNHLVNFKIEAAGTYTFVADMEAKTFTVYGFAAPDVYVFGNIEGASWQKGLKLTLNEADGITYSTSVEILAEGDGDYGYFKFGYAEDFSDNTAIGAVSEGDFLVTADFIDKDPISMEDGGDALKIAPGHYGLTLVLDGQQNRLMIAKQAVLVRKVQIVDENGEEVTEVSLAANESVQLYAKVYPEYASDPTIVWASDKTEIATVDNGLITAVGTGNSIIIRRAPGDETATAVITATTNNQGYPAGTATPSASVTVNVTKTTGINDIAADNNVAAVKYVNTMGQVSDRAFDGVNIVVTTYTDGSQKTTKVIF